MILLKGFFRKKKTIIYIRIFSIVITILFLLNGINNYINRELDRINYELSSLLMFSLNNYEELFKKEESILSYNRALPLIKGTDNDIIYTPNYIINEDGSISYENIDYSKIEWKRLIYDEDNYPYILAFSSSYCDVNLKDNEVILFLEEDNDYRHEYQNKYINSNISFQYNKEILSLNIKSIIEPKNFKYICISNNLYNKLVKKEDKYIYLINTKDYMNIKTLYKKWKDLETNNYYSIQINKTYYDTNRETSLSIIANILKLALISSIIIFIIIIIIVIMDLISDEEKDILLLRQLGYNKKQIYLNILKKVLILDFLIIIISIFISVIINSLINIILDISIEFLSYKMIFIIVIVLLLFELIFMLKYLNHKDFNIINKA